jgi:hypothetical protein
MSSLSNIRFSTGNSVSDGGFPFIMFSFFYVEIKGFDFDLEVNVMEKVLEGLD